MLQSRKHKIKQKHGTKKEVGASAETADSTRELPT